MRIIVNHLTRMRWGAICVAGIDLASGVHVRPMLQGKLTGALLTRHGGPFGIGEIVDLGPVKYVGSPPEIEDHEFNPGSAHALSLASPGYFWDTLQRASKKRLIDIFGPELRKNGRTCTTPDGKGAASLGCLVFSPDRRPELSIEGFNKLRLHFTDGAFDVHAAVTDLRFYEDDLETLDFQTVEHIKRRMDRGVPVVLSVGLTRAFQKSSDAEKLHWLQVNGIHLADTPVW